MTAFYSISSVFFHFPIHSNPTSLNMKYVNDLTASFPPFVFLLLLLFPSTTTCCSTILLLPLLHFRSRFTIYWAPNSLRPCQTAYILIRIHWSASLACLLHIIRGCKARIYCGKLFKNASEARETMEWFSPPFFVLYISVTTFMYINSIIEK